MAAPELVICPSGDAYKVYPGGVIVLQAAEWLGGARGTLSSEADARSCCGTVVRDAQKVTASIYDTDRIGTYTAFQEADDTLTIDLATIPEVEVGIRYTILASVLIEGDWDPTNDDTTRPYSDQEQFAYACNFAYYGDGDGIYSSDSDINSILSNGYQPRGLDSYRIIGWGATFGTDYMGGDEVFHFRAYSQDGTTIEYLIDQIYLVPSWSQPGGDSDWQNGDFFVVSGQEATFSGKYVLNPADESLPDFPHWVDGDDGGDDQGKFTWHPYLVNNGPTRFVSSEGGGDYQRKSDSDDAEYMARVALDDFYYLANTTTSPDSEANAHCYGLHGPFYVPAQTWFDDDFGRVVSDGDENGADGHFGTGGSWGANTDGFAWRSITSGPGSIFGPFTSGVGGHRYGRAAYVDGSEAALAIRNDFQDDLFIVAVTMVTGTQFHPGADFKADNIRFSGRLSHWDVDVLADSGDPFVIVSIGTSPGNAGVLQQWNRIRVRLYPTLEWWLTGPNGDIDIIYGPVSLTGVTNIGWRMEVLRYRLHVKVWDAGGAEPGSWDYDDFRELGKPFSSPAIAYDYGDDLEYAIHEGDDMHSPYLAFQLGGVTMNGTFARAYFDDIVATEDPIGDNASAFASIEQPDGAEIGQIEMPAGCQHLVYWGKRDWTVLDGSDPAYLSFSSKVWNDPAAAELQRSEAVWWWFRSVHFNPDLAPMNWRSASRHGSGGRILTGGR